MERFEAAIIGGGASGLMAARKAALSLKEHGKKPSVVVLEGNTKLGKKLLATGNGRCNLTNRNITAEHYHGDVEEARELLDAYPCTALLEEFKSMGLLCRFDSEGRVYPYNLQAAAVLQTLRFSCEEAGVKFVTEFELVDITSQKGGFLLRSASGDMLWARKCIFACGGKASPKHSTGQGYELLRRMGHSVTELSPSLVPLVTSSKLLKALKGVRCKARASLWTGEKEIYAESGEVIFNENSVSGICVFNLSARLREMPKGKAELRLDLLEEMELSELLAYLRELRKNHPKLPAGELFSGLLNLKLGWEIAKDIKIPREKSLAELSDAELQRAAKAVKELSFPISGTDSWEHAQVTAGGVPLREVDIKSLESKKQRGVYIVGELLNIDGDCGGYNLHWAWLTGLAAGSAAGTAAGGHDA